MTVRETAVLWAETVWGRPVAAVRPLSGGWTSDISLSTGSRHPGGPSSLDVAHCTTYLAMLHGLGVADRFGQAHRALDADAHDPDEARYWSVTDIFGYLPGPSKIIEPWRALDRGSPY